MVYSSQTVVLKCLVSCCAAAGLSVVLYFRVKFYVPDPSMLREEFTRYVLYFLCSLNS